MIDHTKAKSNRELLEAATSFKFHGYNKNEYLREGQEIDITVEKNKDCTWKVSCALGIFDKAEKDFVSVYAYWNDKPCENTVFNNLYEAYGIIMELLK